MTIEQYQKIKEEVNRCAHEMQNIINEYQKDTTNHTMKSYPEELSRKNGKLEGIKLIQGKFRDIEYLYPDLQQGDK